MPDQRLRVVLGWHMHQPEYRDPASGEYCLPWTALHAIKDYTDMAAHIEQVEGARAVVNFAPLLLEQLDDYADQIEHHLRSGAALRDPSLAALVAPHYPGAAAARRRIAENGLRAHPERLIGRYPAYRSLAEQAQRIVAGEIDPTSVPDGFYADLTTWLHLAWLGESIKRENPVVQALLAQERAYTAAQRTELLRIVGLLIGGIVPRYRRLADDGRVELSVTPYGHPIVPLLLDFSAARETLADAPLPAPAQYPGGAERARWHFERALQVFEQRFGRRPRGCWCSEGGVSDGALRIAAQAGFEWTASGQSVLINSAGRDARVDRPYRLGDDGPACFFRDDELSDRIGFRYSAWHGDDAVGDLVNALEMHAQRSPPDAVVTLFLDGENAWDHYPANGWWFLGALYRRLADHPRLRLSTFAEVLDDGVEPAPLPRLVPGSWVHGTFSTWIGSIDKNRGWELLLAAKQVFDRALPGLDPQRREQAERQLAVCEGSDWFWWLGDDNPARPVSEFERLYRLQLVRLHEILGEPVPAQLAEVLSRGGARATGGVMKQGAAAQAGAPLLDRRRAGVLLHPTSLPGADLSHDAFRFVEFLAASGCSVWQVLPLGPTSDGSPYNALSANAGNPMLLSLDWLVDHGWLTGYEREVLAGPGAARHRRDSLALAHQGFERKADALWRLRLQAYVEAQADWLEDYALFRALMDRYPDVPWTAWPAPLRDRDPQALAQARAELEEPVARHRFEQFVFAAQWAELRAYARRHGVHLFGDLPLFVAQHSADVWARRELFTLDEHGTPQTIAGVPPDYYAADGQVWGNPLYRWDAHAREGYAWWLRRMRTQMALFDLVRVDHFRGLDACWELPAGAANAREGRWVPTPGAELLTQLQAHLHPLALVAEDLGEITESVETLRRRFGLPGMRVLQFGFDGSPLNVHLPHNFDLSSVAYTGTHDNATTLEWYTGLDPETRAMVRRHVGLHEEPMPWPLMRAALSSVARLAVLPMQDLLALGAGNRMNTPGTAGGNWGWRFEWKQLLPELAPRLRHLNEQYGRT